jgi:hypothetical protein
MDLPDILVLLNVYLVKLSFDWRYDVSLHLHGYVLWQNRQQQSLLQTEAQCVWRLQSAVTSQKKIILVQEHEDHSDF